MADEKIIKEYPDGFKITQAASLVTIEGSGEGATVRYNDSFYLVAPDGRVLCNANEPSDLDRVKNTPALLEKFI